MITIKVLTTPSCIKCKGLKPVMEQVSKLTGVPCEFLNAIEEVELRNKFNVVSVPFIIFMKGNEVIYTYNGVLSEKEILNIIDKFKD